MPYINEHVAIIKDSANFSEFARKKIADGIDVVLGVRGGKGITQEYRFSKTSHTVAQAKAWLSEHNIEYMSFESAAESNDDMAAEIFKDKDTYDVDAVEIFMTGTWNGIKYNEDDIEDMIKAFNEGVISRDGVPLKLGHTDKQKMLQSDGLPAAGWVKGLRRHGAKLVADFKSIPRVIKELIASKAYRNVSIEVYHDYKDPLLNKLFRRVLCGVALLGADLPAVKGLAGFNNFYTADDGSELSLMTFSVQDGEIKRDPDNGITDDTTDPEDSINKEDTKMDEKLTEKMQADITSLTEQVTSLTAERDAAKAEVDAYKGQVEAYKAQETKAAELAKDAEINAFIEQLVTDGKVLPAQRDVFAQVLRTAEDVDAKKTELNGLPKVIEFKEKSEHMEPTKTEDTETETGVDLHKKAVKYAADNKVSFEEALYKVSGGKE